MWPQFTIDDWLLTMLAWKESNFHLRVRSTVFLSIKLQAIDHLSFIICHLQIIKSLNYPVGPVSLELTTPDLKDRYSYQLSYEPVCDD